jgi:enoyl-CoA hydratase/carnithine racemase
MNASSVHPNINVTIDSQIARLVIDRPAKRNALTREMWHALPAVVALLSADDAVNIVIMEGAGDEAFASGADILELVEHARDGEDASAFMRTVQRAEQAVAACPKPIIAMIRGSCYGGGLELAMACDLRFAAVGSRFAVPPARLGVVYSLSSTRRLVDLIGAGRARDLLFSGRVLDSAEAAAVGLVEREFPAGDLEAETIGYAAAVTRLSQASVRAAKRIVRAILDGAVEEDEALHRLRVEAMLGNEFKERAAAFLEHRKPEFPSS